MQEPDATTNTREHKKRLSFSTGELPTVGRRQINKSLSTDCYTVSDIEDLRTTLPKLDSNNKLCGVHKVALCRCGQSKTYPLCDETHQVFNRETNSELKPLIINFVDNNMGNTEILGEESSQTKVKRKLRQSGGLEKKVLDGTTKDETKVVEGPSQTIEEIPNEPEQVAAPPQRKALPKPITDRKSITAVYTVEDVAQHRTREDCWMIIKGNVYNITEYFDYHPGGTRALLNFAGKDGTENVQFHSPKMMMLLDKYFYIGKLQHAENERGSCVIC